MKNTYRYHHGTKYTNKGTPKTKQILENNPSQRLRKTSCTFQMAVKVYKSVTDTFIWNMGMEHAQ